MNRAEELRGYFREMGRSTAAEAAEALGRPVESTRHTVRDLCKKGWLKRSIKGVYEFNELQEQACGRAACLQEKMWRATGIAKNFTARDIAMLSGATLDYSKKYISFLRRSELIKKAGKDGQKIIYRRTEDAPPVTPTMRNHSARKETEAQALKAKGWELMRAIRDGDMAEAKRVYGEMGDFLGGKAEG